MPELRPAPAHLSRALRALGTSALAVLALGGALGLTFAALQSSLRAATCRDMPWSLWTSATLPILAWAAGWFVAALLARRRIVRLLWLAAVAAGASALFFCLLVLGSQSLFGADWMIGGAVSAGLITLTLGAVGAGAGIGLAQTPTATRPTLRSERATLALAAIVTVGALSLHLSVARGMPTLLRALDEIADRVRREDGALRGFRAALVTHDPAGASERAFDARADFIPLAPGTGLWAGVLVPFDARHPSAHPEIQLFTFNAAAGRLAGAKPLAPAVAVVVTFDQAAAIRDAGAAHPVIRGLAARVRNRRFAPAPAGNPWGPAEMMLVDDLAREGAERAR